MLCRPPWICGRTNWPANLGRLFWSHLYVSLISSLRSYVKLFFYTSRIRSFCWHDAPAGEFCVTIQRYSSLEVASWWSKTIQTTTGKFPHSLFEIVLGLNWISNAQNFALSKHAQISKLSKSFKSRKSSFKINKPKALTLFVARVQVGEWRGKIIWLVTCFGKRCAKRWWKSNGSYLHKFVFHNATLDARKRLVSSHLIMYK